VSGYRKKVQAFHSKSDSKHRGIGISLFYHGCAFTGSGEKDKIKAKVKLRKLKDGCVEILVSNVEFGQGTMTSLRKIVARTLDIPLSSIVYENPDTDRVPDSGPTVASRTVMIVGGLLERAARELKARWHTSNELEILTRYEQPDYIEWDQETFMPERGVEDRSLQLAALSTVIHEKITSSSMKNFMAFTPILMLKKAYRD